MRGSVRGLAVAVILVAAMSTCSFAEPMHVIQPAGEQGANYQNVHKDGDMVDKPSCTGGNIPAIYVFPVKVVGGNVAGSATAIVAFSVWADNASATQWRVRAQVKDVNGVLATDPGHIQVMLNARCCRDVGGVPNCD